MLGSRHLELVGAIWAILAAASTDGPTIRRWDGESPGCWPIGSRDSSFALLQTGGPPALVPLLTGSLAEFGAPIAEDTLPELDEVAVLRVVRVGKAPWESTTDNLRVIRIWRDDAKRQERSLGIFAVNRGGHGGRFAAVTFPGARGRGRR